LDKNLSNNPPEKIHFPFLEKTYQVEYPNIAQRAKYKVKDDVVLISADSNDKKIENVQKCIHDMAKEELTNILNKKSMEFTLPYSRVFIKAPKTRWGSCSSQGNINLNRNLLFLTLKQVEYLITHELCHTVHFNHSSQYWNLVSTFIPDFKGVDRSLKNATLKVPLWALA